MNAFQGFDLYQILGVPDTASLKEIRRAYRAQALRWHPDRHIGESPEQIAYAEETFKLIAYAYEILSDPQTRIAYDWSRQVSLRANEVDKEAVARSWRRGSRPWPASDRARRYYSRKYGFDESSSSEYEMQHTQYQQRKRWKIRWEGMKRWFSRYAYSSLVAVYILVIIGSYALEKVNEKTSLPKSEWVRQTIEVPLKNPYDSLAVHNYIRQVMEMPEAKLNMTTIDILDNITQK